MLKYVLTSFAVPPGCLVFLALVFGIFFLRGKKRTAGLAFLLVAALLWAVSLQPVADGLSRGLESPYEKIGDPRGDVIVLLGGGVYDRAPDLTGEGSPTGEMFARIATAVRLQKRLNVPVVVSGGNTLRNRAPEAPIVKRILVDLGVPAEKIRVEAESRDTRENALHSVAMLRREGFRNPVLVTSAFHVRRAVLLFGRAGMKVTPCPAGFRTWQGKKPDAVEYLPNAFALKESALALREYLALSFYGIFP